MRMSSPDSDRRLLSPRARLALVVLAWLAALAAVGAVAVWAAREIPHAGVRVSIAVDGLQEQVRSNRSDVAGLLADVGLELRAEDDVAPALQTPLAEGLQVVVARARPALVSSDGDFREVFTRASTVDGLLAAAGIRVDGADEIYLDGAPARVETPLPPLERGTERGGLPAGHAWNLPVAVPLHLSVRRAVPITVDDGSVPYTLYTTAPTVGEALLRESVTLYLGDHVQPNLGTRVSPGLRVFIDRSIPVVLSADGRTVQTRTRGSVVGDALMDLGVIVAGSDRVEPALHEPLVDHLQVKVTRVSEVVLVERKAIPFEAISVPDDNLEIDHTRLAQAGQQGEHRTRWRVRYEDGQEIERAMIDEWQAAAPVTQVTAYGRMLVPRTLDTPDGPVTYWRKIRMYATSYSPARSGTPRSAPWYGRTRIGMTLRKGLVAIDPTVIPFHTPLYIEGYGKALAADTGGGVKGKWIDLGYEDHDYESWHWWVDVYVLEPRSAWEKIRWVLPNVPPPDFPRRR